MTDYSQYGVYGDVAFELGDCSVRYQPKTIKTNLGYQMLQKPSPLKNAKDTIISISGVISGHDRTSSQEFSDRVDEAREALSALEDGYYHTIDLGKFTGNYAIIPGTLSFNDSANKDNSKVALFTMEVVSW